MSDPMSKKFAFLFTAGALVCGACLGAAELKPVFAEKQNFTLAPGAAPTSKTVEFPAVSSRKGFGVILRFDARIATKKFAGWDPWLSVALNGKQLTRLTTNGTPRLLLRGEVMKTANGKEQAWWKKSNNALLVFFAPESAAELDSRVVSAREERFVYTLDVTDLVSGDKANAVTFTDLLPEKAVKASLVVKDIEFLYVPETELARMNGKAGK